MQVYNSEQTLDIISRPCLAGMFLSTPIPAHGCTSIAWSKASGPVTWLPIRDPPYLNPRLPYPVSLIFLPHPLSTHPTVSQFPTVRRIPFPQTPFCSSFLVLVCTLILTCRNWIRILVRNAPRIVNSSTAPGFLCKLGSCATSTGTSMLYMLKILTSIYALCDNAHADSWYYTQG
jgi:hypothetical protein